eukprot:CAMPEP_0173145852 /NCGR_PEP_ID=MMETSP1105-20130129/8137_1 /TAXON_ID=2985 /ORGANISM="Ochromonas sp., Strain BG-1" /LENGTH=479 /DNA_ID=CAMNT_0014059927 /DNA_START=271 /DNA_END=1710 /DNA_ORIENTATION=+
MVIQSLLPGNPSSSPQRKYSYGSIPLDYKDEENGEALENDEEGELKRKRSSISFPPAPSPEMVDEVSVAANTINALLGVSLFAMPWGFQQSGILGGLFVLLVVAALSYDTARMLLVSQKVLYQRSGEVKGYPEIASAALGHVWGKVVKLATITSCLGGCTGYLIFFGETVGQALSLNSHDVILIATIPLILLSWIRSFRELTVFTIFGVGSLMVAVIVILVDGSSKFDKNISDLPLFQSDTFLHFIGPATFLFTIHYFILSMGAEALRMMTWISTSTSLEPETSYSALTYPIAISYFVSLAMIALVGIAGFAMYRNVDLVTDQSGHLLMGCEGHVCQNVLLNLSPGLKRNVVGITMSVVIILSYVLILAPAREHIENLLLGRLHLSNEKNVLYVQNALRTVLVLITVTVALKAPYFGSVMGAVGGLTDALQCFVLPPLIYLKVEGDKLNWVYLTYYLIIILWGLTTIVYTAYNATFELL